MEQEFKEEEVDQPKPVLSEASEIKPEERV